MFTLARATNNTVSIIRLISCSSNIIFSPFILFIVLKNQIVTIAITMNKHSNSYKVWTFGSTVIANQLCERVHIIASICANWCDQAASTVVSTVRSTRADSCHPCSLTSCSCCACHYFSSFSNKDFVVGKVPISVELNLG